jgi:hypothetical protein
VLDQLAAERGLNLVCAQPLLIWRAREAEDLTFDKSDPIDAVIIARLATRLSCYEPERTSAAYARLRHLAARPQRAGHRRVGRYPPVAGSAGVRVASGVGCGGCAVSFHNLVRSLDGGAHPLRRRPGPGAPPWPGSGSAAVRLQLRRWGATRPRQRIITAVFDALLDNTGVAVQRAGALERALLVMDDWHTNRARLADTERRMVAVLDGLGLTRLVTSIAGLSAVGAAVILAETGDLSRLVWYYEVSNSLVSLRGRRTHAGSPTS